MFLLDAFVVFSVAYWLSAIVADAFLRTNEERALPPALRAGLGFLLSVLYFSAAWQLMSIQQAWVLALSLAAVYAIARWGGKPLTGAVPTIRLFLASHARSFAGYLAGGLLFFAPLFVANTYGPFTEGGGDVSIYADTAHYLVSKKLTARGSSSQSISDAKANLSDALTVKLDRNVLNALAEQRYISADKVLINPPATDNATYRTLVLQSMSPFLYTPYGQFFFLTDTNNYHVYFGIQAFVYSMLLMAAWTLFRRLGRRPAVMYLALIASSHALISVFYNMYSAHAISLAVCAIVLALLPTIRLQSKAGLRTYSIAATYLWVGYVHFLSVVGPLILLAAVPRSPAPAVGPTAADSPWRKRLQFAAVFVFIVLIAILVVSGVQKSAPFIYDLVSGRISGEKNVYMGERLATFSFHWTAFLFGFISQQHLQPFAVEIPWVIHTIRLGVAAGVASLVMGFVVAVRARMTKHQDARELRFYLLMYGGILFTVGLHVYLAQSYVYTQAKGAQNVLVALYAAMVLPYAVGLRYQDAALGLKRVTRVLGILLLIFLATLILPRLVYTYKIARGLDRAGILEQSFFDEAAKIRERDADPFVLFEPRKSSDLYVSVQPFFGQRMVPTRHLAITRMNFDTRPPYGERVNASLLIGPKDIAHLWTLSATKDAQGRYAWKAERVADLTHPALFLFADDYERNIGGRPRSIDPADVGMFSYLRNGSATLYLPPGQGAAVDVTIEPRISTGFGALLAQVRRAISVGSVPKSARLREDGKYVMLSYEIAADAAPRMVPLVRLVDENWLNVRLNGAELVPKVDPGKTAGIAKVAAALVKDAAGAPVARATWSAIATPNKEDWIGVFPVGGPDSSRIAFIFLKALKEGSQTIPLPQESANQPLEVRLYRAGSWNPLALGPVTAAQPDARAK